ncbi:MAG: peptide ABC transporter permease [Chloroflexi bacterium]|nr:peptide ABC transporter permease [Chloroflexota bacterium]|tara:strand:+ start:9199 stop:10056 length:858 start_codon:yes stop_codon:yes gene_type:complete
MKIFKLFWNLIYKTPIIWVSILSILVLTSAFAPIITDFDPIRDADFSNVLLPPFYIEGGNTVHILGTDQIGRDIFSRMLYGGRVSLLVAGVAILSGTIIGTILGMISGFKGGIWDEIIMRLVDMWIALPFIMVALVIAIVLGQSWGVMFLLLTLIAWVSFVRPIRGEVLSLREREYIQYATSAGASQLRIIIRHILPNISSTVLVIATMNAGGLVLAESILSFLGVGIPAPTPTWGSLVSDGRGYLEDAWWISTMPGISIFLLVMSLNFCGDWLRDRWDPKLNQL